ncbi:MarR family winged helix-turn-helix transcriptional regulator [Corynebacterium sp. TAE3-ERU2]|uniref:MarR family winged helix-turn-helix transcriptional regulator n=1 Tax=Corynebacterium sp. TAE3-ERU2 TaxID=2849497 RepID=UPI001C442FB5|nr:MarR family transcriptional regulator [Corynebacterium sp. TAE3-ERU2]MBV7302015.1 MarR family transcriptional regulator [Corynebacterium sp. TAE3-ERU2]
MAIHPDLPQMLLESPSFQLERLRRRTRDEVEAALQEENTNLREYWVLCCLATASASSQSKLCDILSMDASDMVRLIDALEEKKWVKRERDKQDRRRQIVTTTKKGTKARDHLTEIVTAAEDRALDESTNKQLKHLRKLAKAIMAAEASDED